ncbi:MAG: site-specific integrase [Chloroflexota bacterium]|nr:site-specific integrase [Chloroflexota bacterium]
MARLKLRGGVWYYRAKVPADVRRVLGRGELVVSLGTSDPDTAEARSLELSAAQLRLCRRLRHAGPMTSEEVDKLVAHYMTSFRANREEDSIVFGPLVPAAATERRAWVTGELAAAEEDLLHNRLSATERLAQELMREAGADFATVGHEAYRRLCYRLLAARVDVMRQEAQRLPSSVTLSAPSAPPPSPLVSELVTAYLAHRDATDPLPKNTRTEMVAALAALVSLMGNPAIGAVRAKDAQDFVRKFSQLPQRWRTKYKGRSAEEVLKVTEGQDLPRSAPGTVKKELALIKAFWSWACIREDLSVNAMDAAKPPETGSAKDKRRPFTDAEIAALRPLIEAQKDHRPERYWVTLLCAYSGARLEEMAQLRKKDVVKIDGVWCVRISSDAGSVKNESSERDLPIHSRLLKLGFLEFVEAAKGVRLFGNDEREAKVGAPISKWFAWELDKLNLAERNKKGMHSFRHTMRDKLRRAQVDAVTRREILGHAHEDVEDAVYGDPTGVKERRDALEKVALPL